jgi:GGDEF domain-containing protein
MHLFPTVRRLGLGIVDERPLHAPLVMDHNRGDRQSCDVRSRIRDDRLRCKSNEYILEKIRHAVSATPHKTAGGITVSIGLAIARSDQADDQESVIAADKALYRAKEEGRNRVVGDKN